MTTLDYCLVLSITAMLRGNYGPDISAHSPHPPGGRGDIGQAILQLRPVVSSDQGWKGCGEFKPEDF